MTTTTTHTIQINENPRIGNGTVSAKRVSTSRQYRACVVATATQKTVDDIALGLADHEKQEAEKTPAVMAALTAQGYESIEAVEAAYEVAAKAWHGPYSEERQAIEKAVEQATGKRMHFATDEERRQAEAATEARGFVNPYRGTLATLTALVRSLRSTQHAIAVIKKQNVQVGDQVVVTWCRDAGLAQKALRSNDAGHYGARFYALAVRTDIELTVKESKKRS